MLGLERYLLIGITIASLVGGAYVYVSWQNSKIEVLTKDNVILRDAAERNAETVRVLQEQIAVQSEQNRQLTISLDKSEKVREEMLKIFVDDPMT